MCRRVLVALSLVLWTWVALAAGAREPDSGELEGIVVRALAPAAQAAVVEVDGGGLEVARVGAQLLDGALRIVDVLPDRLVAEQRIEGSSGAPSEVRTVWVEEADPGSGRSRVRVFSGRAPESQGVPRPTAAEAEAVPMDGEADTGGDARSGRVVTSPPAGSGDRNVEPVGRTASPSDARAGEAAPNESGGLR